VGPEWREDFFVAKAWSRERINEPAVAGYAQYFCGGNATGAQREMYGAAAGTPRADVVTGEVLPSFRRESFERSEMGSTRSCGTRLPR
jgi:hypothetical protein